MKLKVLLSIVSVACFSMVLGACGDKESASSSSPSTDASVTETVSEDVQGSVDAVVETVEEMADDAEMMAKDAYEAGEAKVEGMVDDAKEKMADSDAMTDMEAEKDKLKGELGL